MTLHHLGVGARERVLYGLADEVPHGFIASLLDEAGLVPLSHAV